MMAYISMFWDDDVLSKTNDLGICGIEVDYHYGENHTIRHEKLNKLIIIEWE